MSGGAINFNAAFAIPAFEAAFGSPAFFADPNDLDFNFTFNVPGENEQTTTDFSIKADYTMDGMDLIASAPTPILKNTFCPMEPLRRFMATSLRRNARLTV